MLRVERLEAREVPSALGDYLPPAPGGPGRFAVGSDVGGDPTVKVYDTSGVVVRQRLAFEPSFRGGVRAAMADVTGDGTADLIAGAGYGGGPRVVVFDGRTDEVRADFFAYDPSFRGGVNVAAGDFDGDGTAEIVVGAGTGGGPHVRVLRLDGRPVFDAFAYEPSLTSGVHVAAGDLTGDGRAELITGAPSGGGPRVRYLRPDGSALGDFFAYAPSFDGGVHVAAGDLDGDGVAEVVTGPGTGGGPHVRVFDRFGGERGTFLAGAAAGTYGTPVAVTGPASDGKCLVVAGVGPGGAATLYGRRMSGVVAFQATAFDHTEGVAFGSGSGFTVAYSEVLAEVARLEQLLAERQLAREQVASDGSHRSDFLEELDAITDDDVDEWDEADDALDAVRLATGWWW